METRIDDVRAVMDAVGARRAAVVGISEGGPMSLLFAATHPTRVAALVVYGSLPRFEWAPDFPWGIPRAVFERELEQDVRGWGTIEQAREIRPDADDAEAERLARNLRLSASPSAFRRIALMNQDIDVRNILPTIGVPTLVLHRTGDHRPIEGARWTASKSPGATFVEAPGSEHFDFLGDGKGLVDTIESFLKGVWEHGSPQSRRRTRSSSRRPSTISSSAPASPSTTAAPTNYEASRVNGDYTRSAAAERRTARC